MRLPKSIEHLNKLVPNKGRAFDIGFGGGIAFQPLSEIGFNHIDALDLSVEMVELARQKAVDGGLNEKVQFAAGLLDELHPEQDIFDGGLALGVACYQDDVFKLLQSISRVLKPGGVICLDFRNKAFNLFSTNGYTSELAPEEMKEMIEEFAESVRNFSPDTSSIDLGGFPLSFDQD
jgi:SAM-dependent methyltransferase